MHRIVLVIVRPLGGVLKERGVSQMDEALNCLLRIFVTSSPIYYAKPQITPMNDSTTHIHLLRSHSGRRNQGSCCGTHKQPPPPRQVMCNATTCVCGWVGRSFVVTLGVYSDGAFSVGVRVKVLVCHTGWGCVNIHGPRTQTTHIRMFYGQRRRRIHHWYRYYLLGRYIIICGGMVGHRMYIWRWEVPTKTFTLPFFGRRRYIRPTTTRKREKHKNKLAQGTTSYTVDDGGLRGGRPQMNGWGWLVALMGKQLHRCPRW